MPGQFEGEVILEHKERVLQQYLHFPDLRILFLTTLATTVLFVLRVRGGKDHTDFKVHLTACDSGAPSRVASFSGESLSEAKL